MAFDDLATNALRAVVSSKLLGTTVFYLFVNGSTQTDLQGVWNEQTETVDPTTDTIITTQQPRFFVRLSDLTYTPKVGDQLQRNSNTYKVYDVNPDGHGGCELLLQAIEYNYG